RDERWIEYTKKTAQTQNSTRQTALFPLSPPSQKTKARYMNLNDLIHWGEKMIFFHENPGIEFPEGVPRDKFEEKMEWVKDFSDVIGEWAILMRTIGEAESLVRNNGLEHGSLIALKRQFLTLPNNEQTSKIQSELLAFVETESMKAKPKERLLGASESIESVFGKLKTLEATQNKNGFTGFVLAVAAIVAPTNSSVIYTAMTNTPTKMVTLWQKENIGSSAQSKRKMLADLYAKHNKPSEKDDIRITQKTSILPFLERDKAENSKKQEKLSLIKNIIKGIYKKVNKVTCYGAKREQLKNAS
ncbi:hypothetical protein WDW89_08530, partial [Deltaproteobacteria bacterium TL4]